MQPDIPAVPGISRDILGYGIVRSQGQDILGCPCHGGSVRSLGPRSNMSWDIPGHLGPWTLGNVLGGDIPRCPGTSQDIWDLGLWAIS